MIDDQATPQESKSNRAWIYWVAGGGCVLLLCLAGLAVFGLGMLAPRLGGLLPSMSSGGQIGDILVPDSLLRTPVDGNEAGVPDAPIRVDEYADYQCPICQRFAEEVEPQLVQEYVNTGKVRFAFHSMGFFIGAESVAAAEASYCAGDQERFWEMHDIILANWNGENVGNYSAPRLAAFAEKAGLDMDSYQSCLEDGKYSDRVDQDQVDGMNVGVDATPSFILSYTVDGQERTELIRGLIPFEQFQEKLDAALAEMGLQ